MTKKKIEELNPNYRSAMGSLRYAFRLLKDAEEYLGNGDSKMVKKAIQNARHNFRDALKSLGIREEDIEKNREV